VETEDGQARLAEIAATLGVPTEMAVSDAASSLASLMPLSEILQQLPWEPGATVLGHRVERFNPVTLSTLAPGTPVHELELFECRHHERRVFTFYLIDHKNNRRARVRDRALGRWIVRRHMVPDAPIPVDAKARLILPTEMRLPLHIERVFCMNNDEPPRQAFYRSDDLSLRSPFWDPAHSDTFKIPPPPSLDVLVGRRHGSSCSGLFTIYSNVNIPPLCPSNELPILGCRLAPIPHTRGLE
jgi:hypothetical protein